MELPKPVRYVVTAKGAGKPIMGSRRQSGAEIDGNPNLYGLYVAKGYLQVKQTAKAKAVKNAPKVHHA